LSAVLVHQLVLRRAARVVLTLRTGETAPDAVTALWKDGHLSRLELQPLAPDETATLVEGTLGGPVDSLAVRRLWSITQGNALYLRQLVDGELEASRLHQVAGVWLWSGEPKLSPGLVELVSARIGQLPDELSDVVEVLAFGEPLGVPLLTELTNAAAVEQRCVGWSRYTQTGGGCRPGWLIRCTARCSGRGLVGCTLGGCEVGSRTRWPAAAATDQPGTRDRHAGSRRPVQPPNRRPARRVGPHRRGPPLRACAKLGASDRAELAPCSTVTGCPTDARQWRQQTNNVQM
jgi:hypothetical protein